MSNGTRTTQTNPKADWYLAKVILVSSDGTSTVFYRKGKHSTFSRPIGFQPQEMANGIFLAHPPSSTVTTTCTKLKHSKAHKVKGFTGDLSVFFSMKDHAIALQTIDKHCSDLDLTLKPFKCVSFVYNGKESAQ